MKKLLVTILGVAIIATPAFASKARMQALGEDIYGSTYIEDNRNIFLNVANINNYKNFVTYEWGNTANTSDTTAAPRADGGVFVAKNNMVYGVYLGDETNDSHIMRQAGGLTAANSKEENNIGLFVGGEAGLKWGASFVYSSSENDEEVGAAQSEQEAMRARLGVILNKGLEIFSTFNIANKAETGDGSQDFKGKLGYRIGVIHNLNDWRLFGTWSSLEGEDKVADTDQKLQALEIGAGRAQKINDKFTLFTKASFLMVKSENDGQTGLLSDAPGAGTCTSAVAAGGAGASVLFCEEYKRNAIPVVIGMEYAAASWLALRGSVGQVIWGKEEDKEDKRTIPGSTVVNAGASLLFGDMTVDGVIGNNATGGAVGNNGTSTGNGQIRLDSLMSRVSMTYKF